MNGCGPKDIGIARMTRDQSWLTTGYYNYGEKEPNKEAGKPSEIMAIAIVLVAVK
jgi:hypothetical protein